MSNQTYFGIIFSAISSMLLPIVLPSVLRKPKNYLNLLLIMVTFIPIVHAQRDTPSSRNLTLNQATCYPDWKMGATHLYLHLKTRLITNEQDMPVSNIIDTSYLQIKVNAGPDKGYLIQMEHFDQYDVKTGVSEPSSEPLRNHPIVMVFDSLQRYKEMLNWTLWRDTLKKNLKNEFYAKKIDLITYSTFNQLYNQREVIESMVLDYYHNMFTFIGKTHNLFSPNSREEELINPFSQDTIIKPCEEIVYLSGESLDKTTWKLTCTTDDSDLPRLSHIFMEYMKSRLKSEHLPPPPNITIKRTEDLTFNHQIKQITHFRKEESVMVNGAGQFIEYYLVLIQSREK
jgi:hypothetical protein